MTYIVQYSANPKLFYRLSKLYAQTQSKLSFDAWIMDQFGYHVNCLYSTQLSIDFFSEEEYFLCLMKHA